MLHAAVEGESYSFGSGFTDGHIYLGGEYENKIMFRIDKSSEPESEWRTPEQEMGYTR